MLSLLGRRVFSRPAVVPFLPSTFSAYVQMPRAFFNGTRLNLAAKTTTVTSKKTTTSPTRSGASVKRASTKTTIVSTGKVPKTKKKTTKSAAKPKARRRKPVPRRETVKAKPKRKVAIRPTIHPSDRPPKGPGTQYTIFVKKWSADHVGEYKFPDDLGTLGRAASNAWKELSEDEKQVYKDQYTAKRAVYLQERKNYLDQIDPAKLREINKRRTAKGRRRAIIPNKPANPRPITAFLRFYQERLKSHQGPWSLETLKNLSKDAGEQWRALSPAEKLPYEESYVKDRDEWRLKTGWIPKRAPVNKTATKKTSI